MFIRHPARQLRYVVVFFVSSYKLSSRLNCCVISAGNFKARHDVDQIIRDGEEFVKRGGSETAIGIFVIVISLPTFPRTFFVTNDTNLIGSVGLDFLSRILFDSSQERMSPSHIDRMGPQSTYQWYFDLWSSALALASSDEIPCGRCQIPVNRGKTCWRCGFQN